MMVAAAGAAVAAAGGAAAGAWGKFSRDPWCFPSEWCQVVHFYFFGNTGSLVTNQVNTLFFSVMAENVYGPKKAASSLPPFSAGF